MSEYSAVKKTTALKVRSNLVISAVTVACAILARTCSRHAAPKRCCLITQAKPERNLGPGRERKTANRPSQIAVVNGGVTQNEDVAVLENTFTL